MKHLRLPKSPRMPMLPAGMAVFCIAIHAAAPVKVTIGHIGNSCESPVYVAKDKGFFSEEGLDAGIVRGDWNFIKESLAFGRISAVQGLLMNYIKPIEQGLDVKVTAGVHRGCVRILVPDTSPITGPAGLKGKRIGVPALGSSPWIFAARVISELGGDIRRDVEWKPFPAGELKLALQKGEVDAIAVADPIGEILISEGGVRIVVDQLTDAPYKDEYCCAVLVSGKLARETPDVAARITRAILKASLWIEHNPQGAAEIAVNGRHTGGSVEINARILAKLDYVPSVEGGRLAVLTASTALKNAGILSRTTDIPAFVERAFVRLPGLDDAWLKGVAVAREDRISPAAIFNRPLPDGASPAAGGCCEAGPADAAKLAAAGGR
ncbi:ABC transporter substrate-binding protein [Termitidicoccus mucosus]